MRLSQRHIGRSPRMHLVGGDDLVLTVLDRHELSKLRRFGDALPDGVGVRLKDMQDSVLHVRVAAEQPRAGCATRRVTNAFICCSRVRAQANCVATAGDAVRRC